MSTAPKLRLFFDHKTDDSVDNIVAFDGFTGDFRSNILICSALISLKATVRTIGT